MLPGQARIYADCGVDILEVGIPSPDPFMDGELVKNSMLRSIGNGTDEAGIANYFADLRECCPSQYIAAMGYGSIAALVCNDVNGCPVDGIIQVGCEHTAAATAYDKIAFVPYRMDSDDIERAKNAGGYVFLQANDGKTGTRDYFSPRNAEHLATLREAGIAIPVLLGFGLSTPDQVAAAIALGADGVIIGSACLQAAHRGEAALRQFLLDIRKVLDAH